MKLLHVGCANRYYKGFENSDKMTEWKGNAYKLDRVMALGEPWPHSNESIDGIVGMHVFQQLSWRELIVAFSEAYRVLRHNGVLRIGVPMVEHKDKPLERLLGWNNINLFSFDLLSKVLVDRIGFSMMIEMNYKDSGIDEFKQVDNREDSTMFIELIK